MNRRNFTTAFLGLFTAGVATRADAANCPAPEDLLRYEKWRSPDGDYRWRLIHQNENIIASGQGYNDKRGVDRALKLIQGSYSAPIVEPKNPVD